MLGIPTGVAAFFLVLTLRWLFADLAGTERRVAIWSAFAIGMTSSMGRATLGTTMNEWPVVALTMAALWLIVRALVARRDAGIPNGALLVSGALLGIATGGKLTAGTFALAMCVALVLRGPHARVANRARIRGRRSLFGCAVLAGFAVAYGPWGWALWTHYGSPIFPYANEWIQSPWWANAQVIGRRYGPHGLVEWLRFPFDMLSPKPYFVGEVGYRDPRLPLLYGLALGCGFVWLWVWIANRRQLPPATDPAVSRAWRFTVVFFIVAFVLWGAQHSNYRYIVVLDLLAGALIVTLLQRNLRAGHAPAMIIFVAVVVVALTQRGTWGRVDFGNEWFEVRGAEARIERARYHGDQCAHGPRRAVPHARPRARRRHRQRDHERRARHASRGRGECGDSQSRGSAVCPFGPRPGRHRRACRARPAHGALHLRGRPYEPGPRRADDLPGGARLQRHAAQMSPLPPIAHRRWWLHPIVAFALVVAAYACVALWQITLPGVYMDAVNPDYLVVKVLNRHAQPIGAWLLPANYLGGDKLPVLIALYHGSLTFWAGLPFFWLFGTDVTGLRLTHAMFGVAVLSGAFLLLTRARASAWVAALGCIALALDPAFSYAFRTQSYITLGSCAWMLWGTAALLHARDPATPQRVRWWIAAGFLYGVSIFGYFVYAFFFPALVYAVITRAATPWRERLRGLFLWSCGLTLGLGGYWLGYGLIIRDRHGLRGFMAFVQEQQNTLGVFDSSPRCSNG